MTKRIGITGGIGTGKSTVGQILQNLGYPVIDADDVVHQALAGNTTVQEALRQHFGDGVFDAETGKPSRPALAKRIFQNEADKLFLEGLLHPLVREEIKRFFQKHEGQSLAFALVPLLFESGLEVFYDEVWCVATSPDVQIARLKASRGMSDELIHARVANQWSLEEKIKRSQRVLWNDGSVEDLKAQVHETLGS
ncbi:MAG: dephospho-CoA kinase [Vampirovibrionales bacterium]|jgi:dephospho-CoA kinase|nr:dephospho-CoA kinase [Vampirovibrionales bacterium]